MKLLEARSGKSWRTRRKNALSRAFYIDHGAESIAEAVEKCDEYNLSLIKKGIEAYKKDRDFILNAFSKSYKKSVEELKNLIRNTPFTQIGKIYNVSDNAIRKWCDNYNLPHRASEIKSYSDEEWLLI